MRLAYLASSPLAYKNLNVLGEVFGEVHFYLAQDKSQLDFRSLDQQELYVNQVCIRPEVIFQTPFQKATFSEVENVFNQFRNNIYGGNRQAVNSSDPEVKSVDNIETFRFSIDDITFLKFSREIGKYCIENRDKQLFEYDYLLLENNQFMMNVVIEKQQNLFFSFTEQHKCLLNLIFEADCFHETGQAEREFILIGDCKIEEAFDNFYLVKMEQNKIRIAFHIPIQMQKNEEFLNFVVARARSVVLQKLEFVNELRYLSHFSLPIDGFYDYKAQLRNTRSGALVPTYAMWDDRIRVSHLRSVLNNRNSPRSSQEKKWKRT